MFKFLKLSLMMRVTYVGMRVFCVRMKDEGILEVYMSGMRVSQIG